MAEHRVGRSLAVLLLISLVGAGLDAAADAGRWAPVSAQGATCAGLRPAFAQAVFLEAPMGAATPDLPAVLRIEAPYGTGAPGDLEPRPLARASEVGSVYGLAWDAAREQLYAAAYHKRGLPLGPGGPGAIYRIDPEEGGVDLLTRLDVGPDRHAPDDPDDEAIIPWVGRSGLGDIEVDAQGRWLFAVDLGARRIQRFDLERGAVDLALQLGASGQAGAAGARPFGLAWNAGWLYHGLVLAEGGSGPPELRVYRSRADGAEAAELGRFMLDDARRPAWGSWEDRVDRIAGGQPMVVDLEVLDQPGGGTLGLIGLRDRVADLSPSPGAPLSVHTGDLLLAEVETDGRWTLLADRDHLDDRSFIDEAAWGSLAGWPQLGQLAAPFYLGRQAGALAWFDPISGTRLATAGAYAVDAEGENRVHGLGDVERLCAPGMPEPGLIATATAAVAAPTATAAAEVDRRLADACRGDAPFYAGSLHAPGFQPERAGEPALLAFEDRQPEDRSRQLGLATQGQVGSLHGLAWDPAGRRLYAAAFNKAATRFGPGGPGAIYQLDAATGDVALLARLAAGPDRHRFDPSDFYNDPARSWVGASSLGDLEWLAGGLFAVNLADRRIYRIDPVDGRVLARFEHGAAGEAWAGDARPFALAAWQGQLYHGLVRSKPGPAGEPPSAHVYRSAPDGSGMQEVLRFELSGPRPSGARAWVGWSEDERGEPGPEPWLTDLAFRPGGEMLLAFKDRRVDARIYLSSPGELYEAIPLGPDRWVLASPQRLAGLLPEGSLPWGALAAAPPRTGALDTAAPPPDRFALGALALGGAHQGGAAWIDGATARLGGLATLFAIDPIGDGHARAKVSGLGDLEVLCAGPPEPTPSPSARPTVTAVAFPSLAPPTPAPRAIYLPLALARDCPSRAPLELVLVLDLSSSMRLGARDGRPKVEVALEAARGLLAGLRLGAGGDRVGLVGFHNRAWLAAPPSADRAALDLALARMGRQVDEGTRLDLGLRAGGEALLLARPGSQSVMLLVTDGLPNGVPTPTPAGGQAETVLREAARIKAGGARIVTVGVGRTDDPNPAARIDLGLLAAIASAPGDAYLAPDATDLANLLEGLRPGLGCPP